MAIDRLRTNSTPHFFCFFHTEHCYPAYNYYITNPERLYEKNSELTTKHLFFFNPPLHESFLTNLFDDKLQQNKGDKLRKRKKWALRNNGAYLQTAAAEALK